MADYKIEICLENALSVKNAELGGAERVELCSDLFEGGLTPSLGMVKTAKKLSSIKMSVMVRPRGGDFCYTDEEFEVMKEDVKLFRDEGVYSIVFGILNPDGSIDMERNRELIELARPCKVTFHRAFDMCSDLKKGLEDLIELGFDRVLTSGGEASVLEGMFVLKDLVKQAGDRIIVMPGCGIKPRNFDYIRENIGAKEYHVHPSVKVESLTTYRPSHIYMGGMLRQSEYGNVLTPVDGVADYVNRK